MNRIKIILRKASLSLSTLAFLVLVLAPISAYANCDRHIYNKSNVAYVVKCRGCATPWQKTIPPGSSASIEYTDGWHYATLEFVSAGQSNRYRNPSTFGAWRHKNGTTQNYTLAEYGYRKNRLEVSIGKQTHIGGCHNFYFASYENSSNAFKRYDKGHINAPWGSTGYLSLNNPAKMDIKIYASGENSSCYYLKTLIPAPMRGKREQFFCTCVDTKTLKNYSPANADGPCDKPGELSYRSDKVYTPPTPVLSPGAAQLTQKLAGSNWSYTVGTSTIRFRFGKDGMIKGHAPWAKVRWRAKSRNKVAIDASTGASMELVFTSQSSFTASNWSSGIPAYGKRVVHLTPQAIAAFKRSLTGTFWSLTAGNYHDNFQFGSNGYLQRGRWNNRVRWDVTSINVVTLYGTQVNKYIPQRTIPMTLHFNGQKNFTSRGWNNNGWNGQKQTVAMGRRLDARQTTWQPSPAPTTRPARPGCTTMAKARSSQGGRKMTMTLVNGAGTRLMAYWLDFSGNQKYYKSIEPDGRFVINTSTRHPWILRTIDNACRAIIMPNEQSPQVIIR